MFVVMVPQKIDSISDFLMDRINPKRQEAMLLRVQNTKYYMIKCRMPRTIKHWDKLYKISASYKNAFLLPRDIEIPYDVPLNRYIPSRLECIIAVNSIISAMERSKIPLYKRIVGIIDLDGHHQALVHDLLKYSSSIKVMTKNKEKYRPFAKQMLEVYGAVVTICDNLMSFSDCVALLNLGDYTHAENSVLPCPIISIGNFESISPMRVFSELSPTVPAHIIDEVPKEILENIHPMDLLGALFEFNGVREIGKLIFDYVNYGSKTVHFEEFSALFLTKSSN